MCDDITEFENQGFYEKQITRRDFNLMAGGAAISIACLLYTSPSPRDGLLSRMPSSA